MWLYEGGPSLVEAHIFFYQGRLFLVSITRNIPLFREKYLYVLDDKGVREAPEFRTRFSCH